MTDTKNGFEVVFNHDGYGILMELLDTPMSEDDAGDLLVGAFANSAVTALDWCSLTTWAHNCRTRHERGFMGQGKRDRDQRIGEVIVHYNSQPKDLLDIVVERGRLAGLAVYGNVRLNHTGVDPDLLLACPGRNGDNGKKDFRDPVFHDYLLEIFEDMLGKGVDGVSLDFERKAPFFPDDAPMDERREACLAFLRKIRSLTEKPVIVRVNHEREKGEPQGQFIEEWTREGLIDAIIPATHNHEPDHLDWRFDRFLDAAGKSPRPCRVWPQIWPTDVGWGERHERSHSPEAVIRRVEEIREMGANGVYFFNFHCFGSKSKYYEMLKTMKEIAL